MRRLLILVSTIMLVDTTFYSALTPLLPHYAEDLELSKTGAGVLTAAFGAGTLAASIPAGLFAVRFGVKPTVLTGLLLLSGTSLVFGFGDSVWLLDSARFVQGVGGACTWTGALAWLVAAAPADRRGELMGTAIGAGIGGALLGPVVGGAASVVGTGPAFSTVAVLALVLGAFVVVTPGVRPRERALGSLRSRLGDVRILAGMWLVALPAVLFGVLSVLAPLRLDTLGWGAAAIGGTFLVAAGLEAVLSPVVGRLSDRRGARSIVAVAALASALVCVALPWPARAFLLAVLVVAAGLAFGAFWVPAMALLSQGAERSGLEQGFAFALMNLSWAAGQGLGSLGGGSVGDAWGDAVPYLAGAGLCVATLVALASRQRAMRTIVAGGAAPRTGTRLK